MKTISSHLNSAPGCKLIFLDVHVFDLERLLNFMGIFLGI